VPKSRSVRDTEQQEGPSAAVFYAADEPPPVSAPERAGWEQMHKRWTFHAPIDVLEAIEAESKRSGRSKTAVVVEVLRAGLSVPGPRN